MENGADAGIVQLCLRYAGRILRFLNFPLNIICSLGALLLGIRFFKRNPTKGMRIGLILLSILFYFIFVFMMSVYLYMQQMPAPAA